MSVTYTSILFWLISAYGLGHSSVLIRELSPKSDQRPNASNSLPGWIHNFVYWFRLQIQMLKNFRLFSLSDFFLGSVWTFRPSENARSVIRSLSMSWIQELIKIVRCLMNSHIITTVDALLLFLLLLQKNYQYLLTSFCKIIVSDTICSVVFWSTSLFVNES